MDKPKNIDSTVMRVAGNICAGLVGTSLFFDDFGNRDYALLVARSVDLARQIVAAVAPPEPDKSAAETDAERLARIAAVLKAFYLAPVTISSVQPILALAVALNPDLEGQRSPRVAR